MRVELAQRLRARRAEIEQAAVTRVYAIANPAETSDPSYAEGLRAAVAAAVEYGVTSIEHGDQRVPPPPPLLLAQARLAARNNVSLDTVLRRYFAGYTLLGDFVVEQAEQLGLQGGALQRLLRTQAALFDNLIAAVTEEHTRESEVRIDSAEQRRSVLVQRLLAGELIDASDLAYEFDCWHLALVLMKVTPDPVRRLASAAGRRLLLVRRDSGTMWAWLAGRRRFEPSELEQLLPPSANANSVIAIGEAGEGLVGWRLSHRQAAAALPIAQRGPQTIVRYRDAALLASVLQDAVLSASLRQLYTHPLEFDADGGAAAKQTLRTVFASDGNITSAAAALGVERHTVARRLRAIEERIGRPLEECRADLEIALRLDDFA